MMYWLAAPAVLIVLLVALRYWMADPARAIAELQALPDVPEHIKTDLIECIEAAEEADRFVYQRGLSAEKP